MSSSSTTTTNHHGRKPHQPGNSQQKQQQMESYMAPLLYNEFLADYLAKNSREFDYFEESLRLKSASVEALPSQKGRSSDDGGQEQQLISTLTEIEKSIDERRYTHTENDDLSEKKEVITVNGLLQQLKELHMKQSEDFTTKSRKNGQTVTDIVQANEVRASVDMDISDMLVIDGQVLSGSITSSALSGTVIVSEGGIFNGKVAKMNTLIVYGRFIGKADCMTLILGSNALLVGNVRAEKISLDPGATLVGNLSTGEAAASFSKKRRQNSIIKKQSSSSVTPPPFANNGTIE